MSALSIYSRHHKIKVLAGARLPANAQCASRLGSEWYMRVGQNMAQEEVTEVMALDLTGSTCALECGCAVCGSLCPISCLHLKCKLIISIETRSNLARRRQKLEVQMAGDTS